MRMGILEIYFGNERNGLGKEQNFFLVTTTHFKSCLVKIFHFGIWFFFLRGIEFFFFLKEILR